MGPRGRLDPVLGARIVLIRLHDALSRRERESPSGVAADWNRDALADAQTFLDQLLPPRLQQVVEFHQGLEGLKGKTDLDHPGLLGPTESSFRTNLMVEELNEYVEACGAQDPVGILDALCDLTYAVLGTVLAHGMGEIFDEAFAEVHRSNMTKFDGETQAAPSGKAPKGARYSEPDLVSILRRARMGE